MLPGEGFFSKARRLRAVDAVSLELKHGETLGVVGESGCGKSTLARAILGLVPASAGVVTFMGHSLSDSDLKTLRRRRRELQLIFQDPLASLNPRMSVGRLVAEPLQVHFPDMLRKDREARVLNAMQQVGLTRDLVNRYPHEFSGGQCQRIGIARALVLQPKVIICDEPVSALDVSVRAQIINLLTGLRDELGLSLIFIAHDLGVVRHISDRVMVMYLGRVVECAPAEALFESPGHPYTQALIAAVPVADPKTQRERLPEAMAGEVPSPLSPPSGCAFRTRCPWAIEKCAATAPALRPFANGEVACHRLEEIHGSQPAG
ncbi:MAG: ATP-binding cassette domain-containing protein [Gammaproteobacteria bacterium]|nr:ATP-binding cassette domain-containing protein [Gammaproteobacteria bacterium]